MAKMSQIFFILFLSILCSSCDGVQDRTNQWGEYCNKSYYVDSFDKGKMQEEELLAVVQQLEIDVFEGNLVLKGDSLKFGWHKGKLSNPNTVIKALKDNGFYALYHRKEWAYFKRGAGFIDDNCGIMYVKSSFDLPNGVVKSEPLNHKGISSRWYYVETKL